MGNDDKAEDNLLKLFRVSNNEQEHKSLAAATLNLGVM